MKVTQDEAGIKFKAESRLDLQALQNFKNALKDSAPEDMFGHAGQNRGITWNDAESELTIQRDVHIEKPQEG